MSTVISDLSDWLKQRHVWLQEAAELLCEKDFLEESDFEKLVGLCKAEAKGLREQPTSVDLSQLQSLSAVQPYRLEAISAIQGINALAPRRPLNFEGGNLCIVYGNNGSGKSGYVRLLKHASGSRNLGVLHGNVFVDGNVEQKCEFTISTLGKKRTITWRADQGGCAELNSIRIFDSQCGGFYVTQENEVTYEPPLLRFLTRLADTCAEIAKRLNAELASNPSKKPVIPFEHKETPASKWYETLTSQTPPEEIQVWCEWTDKDKDALQDVTERLSLVDPREKARHLRRQKSNIESLRSDLVRLIACYSDGVCHRIVDKRKEAVHKHAAAEEYARHVFDGSPLSGVGTNTWQLMWEAARKYSTEFAYKADTFPDVAANALCVLCQQPLGEEAKQRLVNFEEYVRGELQTRALQADEELAELLGQLEPIPKADELVRAFDAGGIDEEGLRTQILTCLHGLSERHRILLTAESSECLPPAVIPTAEIEELAKREEGLEQQALICDIDGAGMQRNVLTARQKELQAKKWISEQREAIVAEITRLLLTEQLRKAKQLANTAPVSTKKSTLAEEIITADYLRRFQEELRNLHASNLPVSLVKTRAQKGKVFHELRLNGHAQLPRTEEILSEGEFRVVALAAFLADVEGQDEFTPFIFDDPISSLDHIYEEAIAERLAKLALNRQVIVFTHRLSFATLLKESGKIGNTEPVMACVRSEPWGKGEPVEVNLLAKNPLKALRHLRDDRLAKAKKIWLTQGSQEYDILGKSICSDVRILLERIVETELLCGVVERFRRAVNTKGKIDGLARISKEDCTFVDEMMSKYSVYEHSQPQELPVGIPKPDELEGDITKIVTWIEERGRD